MNLVLARSVSLAALIAVCLSPMAQPESSDANIGPTQSGPGAAGLFTPNSPGNAAAYNAQLTGALEGSPIVDGSGANIHISVPMATPSETPGYINYTVGATTTDNRNSYVQDNVQTTRSPAPTINRTNIHPLVFPQTTTAVRATRIASNKRSLRESEGLTTTTTTNLSFRQHIVKTRRTPTDPLSLLGKVDGSIEYNDNQIVLFGANGTLRVNNDRTAVLTLIDGRVITYRDPSNTMHQLATRHEVQL